VIVGFVPSVTVTSGFTGEMPSVEEPSPPSPTREMVPLDDPDAEPLLAPPPSPPPLPPK
jgi:hypothetical protein